MCCTIRMFFIHFMPLQVQFTYCVLVHCGASHFLDLYSLDYYLLLYENCLVDVYCMLPKTKRVLFLIRLWVVIVLTL